MESTHEFVEKLHDNQEKAENNKQRHGANDPGTKTANKQKSNNK